MSGILRLFWAVNLPGEIKAKLKDLQDLLRLSGADAKWVDYWNLHITLKFLGDADAGMVPRIVESAEAGLTDFKPFRLEISGLGFFSSDRAPRVLWAGLNGEVEVLRKTARVMEESMAGLGFPREKRKFSPHLTLARIRSAGSLDKLSGEVAARKGLSQKAGGFLVSSVDLMQSDLTPRGPVYTLLASVKLRV